MAGKPIVTHVKASKFDKVYADYLGSRSTLERLSGMLKSTHEWVPRFQVEKAETDIGKVYRQMSDKRGVLDAKVAEFERKFPNLRDRPGRPGLPKGIIKRDEFGQLAIEHDGTHRKLLFPVPPKTAKKMLAKKMALSPLSLAELPKYRVIQNLAEHKPWVPTCETVTGTLSSTRQIVSLVASPDDDDTGAHQTIDFEFPGTPGSTDLIKHEAYIHDTTIADWLDDNEYYAYWAALGYEFPAPACDSYLWTFARVQHNLNLTGTADYRALGATWLQYPSWDDEGYAHDPRSLDDFDRYETFWTENVNGVWIDAFVPGDGYMWGFQVVPQGKRTKVWIGIYVFLAGLDGTSATGWDYLNVWNDMDQQPGVWFQTDPI